MDASIADADVAWLRSRQPFASMNATAFPRSMPLEGILRNDTRLHRCEPGEIIVREGDYGNSAFLVLAGSAAVVVKALLPEQLGRTKPEKLSWSASLRNYLTRSKIAETRRPEQVTSHLQLSDLTHSSPVRSVDDRPTIFLQDFNVVLRNSAAVSLGPGELFGEVAAMYRSPHTATVIAETEITLLEIRWQGLKILRRDSGFAGTLDSHYRKHWLAVHLRELPLMRHVPESSLAKVVAATEMRSFGRMEWNADYKRTRTLPAQQQIASEPVVIEEGRADGLGRRPQRLRSVVASLRRVASHDGLLGQGSRLRLGRTRLQLASSRIVAAANVFANASRDRLPGCAVHSRRNVRGRNPAARSAQRTARLGVDFDDAP